MHDFNDFPVSETNLFHRIRFVSLYIGNAWKSIDILLKFIECKQLDDNNYFVLFFYIVLGFKLRNLLLYGFPKYISTLDFNQMEGLSEIFHTHQSLTLLGYVYLHFF